MFGEHHGWKRAAETGEEEPECGRPRMPRFGDREQQKGFRQRSCQVRLEFYEDYSGYKVGIDRRE